MGGEFAVRDNPGEDKTLTRFSLGDFDDTAIVYMNVDELEGLAILLLYKAKLIRENNV